ncbi:SH2 domain-containing protein [Trichonephila inaurata madagascariensis]|uniref:SH2 domain-containing protein n=1 Tax=Trichonephila inaurata madagascariensis TaxID=2747483 RepID=A0A8X6YU65_9ARAC|nr:SH2 domain-containing protein [Trichonephila inaurata madagascariensis]
MVELIQEVFYMIQVWILGRPIQSVHPIIIILIHRGFRNMTSGVVILEVAMIQPVKLQQEIALEVLAEKPEGSFIVRKSTTKPGCFALSLRVPQEKNPTGIAHYLILQTNKGYKIKGFTKEFSSLNALITHHSVMPELLPCPLNLSRQFTRDAEHEFEETEQKTCDIFSDIHWLMTDLEV